MLTCIHLKLMDLTPLLPPLPTLTLVSTQLNDPPDKLPEPSIAVPFPEATNYKDIEKVVGNPFRGPLPQKLKLEHQKSLQDALKSIGAPFHFELKEPIRFDGEAMGLETSTEDFNAALTMVTATIERGYYSSRAPTPLSPNEWARLTCNVLAAIGRGYHRQYGTEKESELEEVRAGVVDPNPLTTAPTLFHRIASIADDISTHVGSDLTDYKEWYHVIKEEFTVKATKAAAIEVEEKFLPWKENQFDRRANEARQEIAAFARAEGDKYFIELAERTGLIMTRVAGTNGAIIPPPTVLAGKKRSASGSTSNSVTNTPVTTNVAMAVDPNSPRVTNSPSSTPRGRPTALARGRSRAAALSQVRPNQTRDRSAPTRDRTVLTRERSSSPPKKRGRALTPSTSALFRTRLDSLTRPASPQAVLTLSPKATINLGTPLGTVNPPPPRVAPPASGMDTVMASLQAILGPAIKAAMAPYAAKLDALEKAAMPPPVARPPQRQNRPIPTPTPIPATHQVRQGHAGTGAPPPPPGPPTGPTANADNGFTQVTRKSRKGKGKAGPDGQTPGQPQQINLTPASYASTAANAANIQQPRPLRKTGSSLPLITEVTVLRSGGHVNPHTETQIRARAADAIVREVRINMGKKVAKPIPLRAGRWSIHPRSKGNFVFSFDGCIPFDTIQSYEQMLLEPFYGSGQLCPSMGWTRFVVHGVPTWAGDHYDIYGPDEMLEEVRLMPGLEKAVFAMQPRWLRPVDTIETNYSSITFAVSDPDGVTTNALLNGRSALFDKEVTVRKWVDKPALIQCSRCHALGHNKTSKACTLSKDSVKCYICGGTHSAEKHDKHCLRTHAVAGLCDCRHLCLNCQKTGHNCRDTRCPV